MSLGWLGMSLGWLGMAWDELGMAWDEPGMAWDELGMAWDGISDGSRSIKVDISKKSAKFRKTAQNFIGFLKIRRFFANFTKFNMIPQYITRISQNTSNFHKTHKPLQNPANGDDLGWLGMT